MQPCDIARLPEAPVPRQCQLLQSCQHAPAVLAHASVGRKAHCGQWYGGRNGVVISRWKSGPKPRSFPRSAMPHVTKRLLRWLSVAGVVTSTLRVGPAALGLGRRAHWRCASADVSRPGNFDRSNGNGDYRLRASRRLKEDSPESACNFVLDCGSDRHLFHPPLAISLSSLHAASDPANHRSRYRKSNSKADPTYFAPSVQPLSVDSYWISDDGVR